MERILNLRSEYRLLRDQLGLIPLRSGTVADYADTLSRVLAAEPIDVVFLAMAVSDYEPRAVSGKIRSDSEIRELRLYPTPKIIKTVRDRVPDAYLVGFKLLSGASIKELIFQAREACEVNRVNLTVANDLEPMRQSRHTIHLVRPGQPVETVGPGPDVAVRLVDRVLGWAAEHRSIGGRR